MFLTAGTFFVRMLWNVFNDKTNMFLSFETYEDKERAKEIICKFSPVSSVSKVTVKQLRRVRSGKTNWQFFKKSGENGKYQF